MARLRAQFVLPFTAAPRAAVDAGAAHGDAHVPAVGASAAPTGANAGSGPGLGSEHVPEEAAERAGEGGGLDVNPAHTRVEGMAAGAGQSARGAAAGARRAGSHAGLGSDENPFALLVRDSRGARNARDDAAAGATAVQGRVPLFLALGPT